MKRIAGILASICFFALILWVPHGVYAGNPPDSSSTVSGNSAPADGSTTTTITITLKNANVNLSSSDNILITSDSNTHFNPSNVTLDGSGTFTTQMYSTTVGSVPIIITDTTTNTNNLTIGSITFYQPGSATPTPTPTPNPNACTDAAPGGTAKLTSAVSAGPHSITLTWTDAPNPVSYYLLSYGLSSGNYMYGNPNIGGQGTTSYTVGSLATGTKYYFAIRAGNGCSPGNYSNEVFAVAGASAVPTPTPTLTVVTVTTDTPTTPTDTPIPTITPAPTEQPTVTPEPTGGSIVGIVVAIGTAIGVLIVAGIGVWIFIQKRRPRPPITYF